METRNATVWINKKGITVNLAGHTPEKINELTVYEGYMPDKGNDFKVYANNNKMADLDFLAEYPNVESLFINGNFANVDGISHLKGLKSLTLRLESTAKFTELRLPELKSLSVYGKLNEGFQNLLSDSVESLELGEIRNLSDLSFLESLSGLKKLNLVSLSAMESLPDFGKMPNLYALRIYELHKLNDIESLAWSNIRYLIIFLAADKLSGTKISDVLLRMEHLEKACLSYLDRSSEKRYNVIENKFKKAERNIPLDAISNYDEWEQL